MLNDSKCTLVSQNKRQVLVKTGLFSEMKPLSTVGFTNEFAYIMAKMD